MKKKYDLAISLGGSCGVSQALRREKRQFASFPFDWLGKSSFRKRVELIVGDFSEFLTDKDITSYVEVKVGDKIEKQYLDQYGFIYAHDFDQERPIAPQIPVVREKYLHRLAHMSDLIRAAKRVLIVWADLPPHSPEISDDDLEYARDAFSHKWPGTEFEFVAFKYDGGIPYVNRLTECRGPFVKVTFNTRDDQPGGIFMLCIPPLQHWFRTNIEVRDYRTPQERKEWDRKERLRKYERYGARNYLEMVINRWQIKIYKTLSKRLAKKGVI